MINKQLGATLIALFLFVLECSSANAGPLTWTLQDVTFADLGTASGSFVYDATTNVYSGIDISVSGTSTFPATVFEFQDPSSITNAGWMYSVDSSSNILTGAHFLGLNFESPLTSAGGTAAIMLTATAEKGTCINSICSGVIPPSSPITGGSVTTVVPEPASLPLIPLGLLAIAAAKRLRARR